MKEIKYENMECKKIEKKKTTDSEGTTEKFIIKFKSRNEDQQNQFTLTSMDPVDIKIGEKIDIKFFTSQTTLKNELESRSEDEDFI